MTAQCEDNFGRSSDGTTALPVIASRYLLVINVPLYADANGQLFANQLWLKDLAAHPTYLLDFTLACPVIDGSPPEDAISLSDDPRCVGIKLVRLPSTANLTQALALLPITLARLWHAIIRADLVHSGVAGWPVPLGWLTTPIARILRRRTLIIVESAPWRLQPGFARGRRTKLKARIYERLAQWCLRSTDLAIYTHEQYRLSLPPRRSDLGHVIPASWIDEQNILSETEAVRAWEQKGIPARSRQVRILFAGRLDAEKGILVLLEAITILAKNDVALQLDILGTGSLAPACKAISDGLSGMTRVQLLGTVAYGTPLFQLLRKYDAVIVPSISDEQPRIVYDSFSQAVPVIGSSTAGLRECITEGQTGWLVRPGDAADLACALERAVKWPDKLQMMGLQAIDAARAMTHQSMHRRRHALLLKLLQESRIGPGESPK